MFDRLREKFATAKKLADFKTRIEAAAREENFEEVINLETQALSLQISDSDRHVLLHNRGGLYLDLGKNQKALADFDAAITLKPNNYHGYAGRAAAHLHLGNYQLAKQDFEIIFAKDNATVDDLSRRGHMHYAMGNFAEALADYTVVANSVFKQTSDAARAHIHCAQVYEAQGNKESALTEYRIAKRNTSATEAALNSYICEKLQQLGDTAHSYSGPTYYVVSLLLQYLRTDRYADAQQCLKNFLSKERFVIPFHLHTDFMRCMRKIEKHAREEKTAVDTKPRSEEAIVFLARLENNYCLQQETIAEYREDKDSAELVKSSYDKMIALNPEKSDGCYVERAWWYIGCQEPDKALEDMKSAINLNKRHVVTLFIQMKMLLVKNNIAAESYYNILSTPDYYKHLTIDAVSGLIEMSKDRNRETAALAPMVQVYLTMADATLKKPLKAKKEITEELSASALCEVALATVTYLLSELAQHDEKLVRIEKALAEKGITIEQAEKIQANTALYKHIGTSSPILFKKIQQLTGVTVGDEMREMQEMKSIL